MASIGIGMSALGTPESAGFAICSHTSTGAPTADNGGGQKPNSAPECPFCYLAAQCAGHMALTGHAVALPAYTAVLGVRLAHPVGDSAFVPQLRRLAGGQRAPPNFSV